MSNQTTDLEPTYDQYPTIYYLINPYIKWINDKKVHGCCIHSHKEKLDWVIHYHGDKHWDTASQKIDRMLEDVYLDRQHPKSSPECLKLTPNLCYICYIYVYT